MEHKFSLLKYMALSLVIVISTIANVHADSETEVFVSNINSNWTQRQYTNILNAIDNRLASQTNDILALGLKVGYYYWAEVDLDQAKLAASNFIAAVNLQDPQYTNQPGFLLEQAESIAEISLPPGSNVTARTQEQINFVHQTYPATFPHMKLYTSYANRVNGE